MDPSGALWPNNSRVCLTDAVQTTWGIGDLPPTGTILTTSKMASDDTWHYFIQHDNGETHHWRPEHLKLVARADNGWDDWPLGDRSWDGKTF